MAGTANTQNSQIVRWILVTLVVVLLLLAMWLIRDILMLTLTSVILAILLDSPIRFFVRHNVRRPIAVLLTLALVIVLIGAATALLLPGLLDQFRDLIVTYIPRAAEQLQTELQPRNLIARFPFLEGLDIKGITDQISNQFLGGLANLGTQVFPFVGSLASFFLSILIVLFLALYFIADPITHQRGLLRMLPIRYRPRAQEILIKLDVTLRKYLAAQIVLMLLTGTLTGIALWLMQMPLAGVLGTITGLFSFVPNFGPLLALGPILAVAIINVPSQVGVIIVVFYILQFLLNQLIAPILVGQEINLPPAIVLLSQIVAGIFFGFLGLLLSVPLAAIIVVLVREIYVKDILGDVGAVEEEPLLVVQVETDGV